MLSVRDAAQKYLEETATDVDAKLSDLFKKKKGPEPVTETEPEPLVKGEVQKRLTDVSVDRNIKGMKGLSGFLFGVGIKPGTWARLSSQEKDKVSRSILPSSPTDRVNYSPFSSISAFIGTPRTDYSSREFKGGVEYLLDKLSDFPQLKSEAEEYLMEFVNDPNKIATGLPGPNIGHHVGIRDYPHTEKETPKLASEELIASDVVLIEEAVREVEAADREIEAAWGAIEAARKRKKKWIKGINLKKGRLGKYKRPGESMDDAAERALKSDDPSVRGMGSFYKATRRFKHGKGKKD